MLNEIDLARADLNLLVLFEVVLETHHVGRAAERLSLSPSAISHGLGRLRRLLNDPLFLKTPKGVVPTARAAELAAPIRDVLARVRSVISTAEKFDPATSVRRFTIGAPDGASAVFLPPLLTVLRERAPGIDISVRQLLPTQGETSPEHAWRAAFADLDARAMDIAIIPTDDAPMRFAEKLLYEEDFVIAMRTGHPFSDKPTIDRFLALQHLLVSHTGDAFGFIDRLLAEQGLSRRIALTVPNFMFALAVIAESDLVAALPRAFVAMHGGRFGVAAVEAPMRLNRFRIRAIAPRVALQDEGLEWLFDVIETASAAARKHPVKEPAKALRQRPQRRADRDLRGGPA